MSGPANKRPGTTGATRTWRPLVIHAAGMCCAVGYHLAAASCALRAGIDHFRESPFIDQVGKSLLAAQLDLEDLWGPQRLAQIVNMAVADCTGAGNVVDPASTVLILVAAERGRPHTDGDNFKQLYQECQALFASPFHAGSAVFPQGRAGIGDALWHAQTQLQHESVERVLLVGADSLLDAATIEHFLSEERLLCTDNASGFIPGEGAAAVLLGVANPSDTGLHINGVGTALEEAKPDGEIPNRAIGLTAAMRQALALAELPPNALDFRANDQNGETFFAKEAANAYARLMGEDGTGLPTVQVADCVGETGGAAPTLTLAFLSELMSRDDAPGTRALLHFASDEGQRAALIVEYRHAKPQPHGKPPTL